MFTAPSTMVRHCCSARKGAQSGCHPAPPRPPVQRGFTLVEVLVALLIMSVMAAMGWQGVGMMSRTREYTSQATERTLRLQTLMAQWQADLQAVYHGAAEQGMPGLQFRGNQLRLVRRNEGGVQVVVWALREGLWQRWAGPVVQQRSALDVSWGNSLLLSGREPEQVKLLDGVSDWQLYFYRDQGWSNAQSSDDVANPVTGAAGGQRGTGNPGPGTGPGGAAPIPQRTVLPKGVRLQIDLPEGRITRDVLMSPQLP